MPELRRDPILGRWIIISKERSKRPTDFLVDKPEVLENGFCPLCPGNEVTTPPEVFAFRDHQHSAANTPGWKLRVVPNKYPALIIEGELDKEGEGLYDKMGGIGAHEVFIETPDHERDFSYLPVPEMAMVFQAYRNRIIDLMKDMRFQYVMIFKNHGKAAGASLEHSHSQLIALPVLPHLITSELNGSLSYYKYKERCIYCDIIKQEMRARHRVVCQNEDFISIAPFAPRTPFEMWILPKRHRSTFREETDEAMLKLAEVFSESLRRLDTCIADVPYNFVLHTGPLRTDSLDYYHYHFEIVPTLTSIAGFEWGSGFHINPVPPEEAAAFLRSAM